MKVSEVMTHEVRVAGTQQTIREAAHAMAQLEAVAKRMDALGLRRLPVLDRNKRLVGMLSASDVALLRARRAEASISA